MTYKEKAVEIIEVTVCLEALFNRLKEQDTDDYVATSYGHIQKESDGNKEWFDFINDTLPYEGRACMDGETCEIIEETEEYILLQEIDEQIPFKLSKDEFEFSTMLCR